MSASLVGSEMCIRDSSFSSLRRLAPDASVATVAPDCRARAGASMAMLSSCLLYTSDAADDM
eukprot:744148-Alexandrium_andersonii.AAC.1